MQDNLAEEHNVRKTTLDNGLRVITQRVPHFKSVSIGIWVRAGSRFEEPSVNGICHFIEHMLFKGTDRRSALDIAREVDSVGGILNAFTSKELTAYYCRVMDQQVELAVDLLSDIFLNASFPEDEIEREKQVVCQEIFQTEDNPEDYAHEILGMRLWENHPLGQTVLGTVDNIAGLGKDLISGYKNRAYNSAETIVCGAGSLEHDRFVDLIAKYMETIPVGPRMDFISAAGPTPSKTFVERDLEQIHVCLGMEGLSASDNRRHAAYLLNTIFGGGMSSRLFQEVREKKGLAYSIYSYVSSFFDTGMFGVYAGCEPARFDELMTILRREMLSIAETITEEELLTAKNQMKGGIILSLESSESLMNRLAKGEFYFGRWIPLEEIMAMIDKVALDDLVQCAKRFLAPERSTVVALGPRVENGDSFKAFLA